MNKAKNITIATLLLCVLSRSVILKGQSQDSENIIIETITPETTQEELEKPEEQKAIQKWNAHLESLKIQDQHWNKNSNTPTDSWKEEAITLAKEELNQDNNLADTLKSAFFNAITDKVKLEEGEFTASTYALIKEFDDAIDKYVATLKQPEEEPAIKTEEEVQLEPVVEQTPVTIEVTPTPIVEEPLVNQPETTMQPTTEAPNHLQEWNSQLTQITTAGSSESANKTLLIKTYELAKELVSQGYTGESLFDGFKYAIFQHNANQNLFPIKIGQAIEAFSAETGIAIPNDQLIQQEYNAAMQKQIEQQEMARKQKEAELKTAAVQEAIKQADIPESKMEELNKLLQRKLDAEHAARIAQQKETDAQIASLKKELASVHKTKTKEAPQEQGIIGKAIGAVKGAASAATAWWYGQDSQEEKDIKVLDEQRFEKLQEILKTMPLTPNQKLAIEHHWTTFITHLRSFKNLDIHSVKDISTWLNSVQQSLEFLIFQHAIISKSDAIEIMKNAIKQYTDSSKFINSIESRLTKKEAEIIKAETDEKNAQVQKTQAQARRKELAERKKQNIQNEKKRISNEQNIINAYNNKEKEWQQFLIQIMHNKQATEQDNNAYTNQAIKMAEFLLYPMKPVVVKNKLLLEQQLKQEFTKALLEQQKGNDITINIYKNIDQFNNALDTMT